MALKKKKKVLEKGVLSNKKGHFLAVFMVKILLFTSFLAKNRCFLPVFDGSMSSFDKF